MGTYIYDTDEVIELLPKFVRDTTPDAQLSELRSADASMVITIDLNKVLKPRLVRDLANGIHIQRRHTDKQNIHDLLTFGFCIDPYNDSRITPTMVQIFDHETNLLQTLDATSDFLLHFWESLVNDENCPTETLLRQTYMSGDNILLGSVLDSFFDETSDIIVSPATLQENYDMIDVVTAHIMSELFLGHVSLGSMYKFKPADLIHIPLIHKTRRGVVLLQQSP